MDNISEQVEARAGLRPGRFFRHDQEGSAAESAVAERDRPVIDPL